MNHDTESNGGAGRFPVTAPSFIDAMVHGLDIAWQRFAEEYTGPALLFFRALGVKELDAEDYWQEFFHKWLKKDQLTEYSREQGRFRSWLITCLRNHLRDEHARAHAQRRDVARTDSLQAPLPGGEDEDATPMDVLAAKDLAEMRRRLAEVHDTMKFLLRDYPKPEEAAAYLRWFWKSKGQSDKEFAQAHGMTRNQLNELRKRVEKHLRQRADESER